MPGQGAEAGLKPGHGSTGLAWSMQKRKAVDTDKATADSTLHELLAISTVAWQSQNCSMPLANSELSWVVQDANPWHQALAFNEPTKTQKQNA